MIAHLRAVGGSCVLALQELGFENGEGNGTETTKGGADDDDDDSDDDSDDDIQIQEFNFDDDSDAEGGDETPEEAVNSIASLLDDEEVCNNLSFSCLSVCLSVYLSIFLFASLAGWLCRSECPHLSSGTSICF